MKDMLGDLTGPLGWEGFLRRPPLPRDKRLEAASLEGKIILITGAGGSIGSVLAMAVAEHGPRALILLEASERNLYDIGRALDSLPIPREHASLLGSVADSALLDEIFRTYRPHIVYHAAAFKHVPLMEQNPFAAIRNNALATDLLHRAATTHGAEQVILLSTDKAVDPISIMGASKRIAELILLAPHTSKMKAKAVRLGNVLGSEGSIVPLFLQQIAAGAPVTVTHRDIRRYFLTPADAVTLLLHAASQGAGEGVLVPDLGQPETIETLARYLIGSQAGDQNSIVFTHPRPGDKMCEALLSARESYRSNEGNDGRLLRSVDSPDLPAGLLQGALQDLQAACNQRSLQLLLTAVLRLVPEYLPSALLGARPEMA